MNSFDRDMSIFDVLCEREYMPGEPERSATYGEWQAFDLPVGLQYSVRAVLYEDDGNRWEVYLMRRGGEVWSAKFSGNAPHSAILAVVEAAEVEAREADAKAFA